MYQGYIHYNYSYQYHNVHWQVGDNTAHAKANSRRCFVKPYLNCIETGCGVAGETGHYTAHFGYHNLEDFTVTIPASNGYRSDNNQCYWHYGYNSLRPRRPDCRHDDCGGSWYALSSCNQSQPTLFLPGRHDRVFSACFNQDIRNADESVIDGHPDLHQGRLEWQLISNGYSHGCYYNECHSEAMVRWDGRHSRFCNRGPVCNAGGRYQLSCTGDVTNVALGGFNSFDPEGNPLSYFWQHNCQGAELQPDDTVNPTLSLKRPLGGKSQQCQVTLTVTESTEGLSATCSADVAVADCPIVDLGCHTVNVSQNRGVVESLVDAQRRLLGVAVGQLQDLSQRRRAGRRLVARADRIYAQQLELLAELPAESSQCTNTQFCVSIANSEVPELLAKSKEQTRSIRTAIRALRQQGGATQALRHTLRATRLHRQMQQSLALIPAFNSFCAEYRG